MVIIDTSAWIEYFRNGDAQTCSLVEHSLDNNLVGVGDLIYCELIQGIRNTQDRKQVSSLLQSLPHYDMVGFTNAACAADSYRRLRSKGITIRKTIDMLVATFCIENGFSLIHFDRDFTPMATHLGLKIFQY